MGLRPADTASFDIIIAGSGPVAVALAAMLADSGLSIATVAPAYRAATSAQPRPIALSAPSHALLARLGLVHGVDFTPIDTIHVSQRGGFGRTVIRAGEHRLPALGYVCDFAYLARAMAIAPLAGRITGTVTNWTPAADGDEATAADATIPQVRVDVADTDGVMHTFGAQLLVVADGSADSGPTRTYGQTAITTTIRTERPHHGVAWERFTAEGPLALLPCADRYAVVWSMRDDRAHAMLHTDDGAFATALAVAFGGRLGRFSDPGPRIAYPLLLRQAADAGNRVALRIGNAAQTLHPVAGQGLNLGLRDAQVLADHVLHAGRDALGSDHFAKSYLAARARDRMITVEATDFLARIFTIDATPMRIARGLGLAALDAFPPARNFIARRMMLGAR